MWELKHSATRPTNRFTRKGWRLELILEANKFTGIMTQQERRRGEAANVPKAKRSERHTFHFFFVKSEMDVSRLSTMYFLHRQP